MDTKHLTLHRYLIERSRLGDREAQGELYNLYVKAMYNICRRMMGDQEEAKDVLQEAFIHAFTQLNKLQSESAFPAWIKRVVVNHCLNALKKKSVIFISEEGLPDDPDNGNDDFLEQKEIKLDKVMAAVDKLSEGCKTVLNLYAFEGYDHSEIAHILNITESASKSQYSKAKRRIRELIGLKF